VRLSRTLAAGERGVRNVAPYTAALGLSIYPGARLMGQSMVRSRSRHQQGARRIANWYIETFGAAIAGEDEGAQRRSDLRRSRRQNRAGADAILNRAKKGCGRRPRMLEPPSIA